MTATWYQLLTGLRIQNKRAGTLVYTAKHQERARAEPSSCMADRANYRTSERKPERIFSVKYDPVPPKSVIVPPNHF